MAVSSTITKTKKPAMRSKFGKDAPSSLVGVARRRRQRVLKPVKRDPFLVMGPSRKANRRIEPIRIPAPAPECPCNPQVKSKFQAASGRNSRFGRSVHPHLVDVGGGVAANVLLAQRIPERLNRPVLQEADPEAIGQAGHDAGLAVKGLEIIRKELIRNGEQLFQAVANTAAERFEPSHTRELPEFITLRVPKRVRNEHVPSHMLAVHSSEHEVKTRKVVMVPIHATVLAAHCSRVPTLPSPRPLSPSLDPLDSQCRFQRRVVSLVPFSIPSPDTFPLMTKFLCTQDAAQLFQTLVPIASESCAWKYDSSYLAEELANTYSGASLVSGAMRVYGVWQNACSLGVLNPHIWQVIDVSWKSYRDALLLARR